MSWAKVKKINSDMTTPINIANWINHIDLVGSSYIGRADKDLSMELCKADMLYLHPVASTVVGADALSTEEKFETLGFEWLCRAAGVSPAEYSNTEDVIEDVDAMLSLLSNANYARAAKSSTLFNSVFDPMYALSAMSWNKIEQVSNFGAAAGFWSLEEEKNIVVNGETITLMVHGFDHDNLTGGGKAGVTIGMKDLMASTRQMNGSNTNANGWGGCAMRTWITGTLIGQLPVELQAVLKPVDKLTSAGSQSATINTTSDKVFLFSEVELFGGVTHSRAGEGSQYPVYTDNASRIKRLSNGSGAAYGWWERSPSGSDSTSFCRVSSDGTASNNDASHSRGVCCGFCV